MIVRKAIDKRVNMVDHYDISVINEPETFDHIHVNDAWSRILRHNICHIEFCRYHNVFHDGNALHAVSDHVYECSSPLKSILNDLVLFIACMHYLGFVYCGFGKIHVVYGVTNWDRIPKYRVIYPTNFRRISKTVYCESKHFLHLFAHDLITNFPESLLDNVELAYMNAASQISKLSQKTNVIDLAIQVIKIMRHPTKFASTFHDAILPGFDVPEKNTRVCIAFADYANPLVKFIERAIGNSYQNPIQSPVHFNYYGDNPVVLKNNLDDFRGKNVEKCNINVAPAKPEYGQNKPFGICFFLIDGMGTIDDILRRMRALWISSVYNLIVCSEHASMITQLKSSKQFKILTQYRSGQYIYEVITQYFVIKPKETKPDAILNMLKTHVNVRHVLFDDDFKHSPEHTLSLYKDYIYDIISKKIPLPPAKYVDSLKNKLSFDSQLDKIVKSKPLIIHIGQRKLFLSELQYLTGVVDPSKNYLVVYAGAAPSNHTALLFKYFNNVKFILVDPNKFDIFKYGNIQPVTVKTVFDIVKLQTLPDISIINDLFTDDVAEGSVHIANKFDRTLLFISDIRTSVGNTQSPMDIDILWNLAQQHNWMKIMRPHSSLLKFRHPFYDAKDIAYFNQHKANPVYTNEFAKSGIDYAANYEARKLKYPKGLIFVQAFAPITSAETRLLVSDTDIDNVVEYEPYMEYESKMFYYNAVERCVGYHVNPYADNGSKPPPPMSKFIGFDHCGDCALEAHIWESYNNKTKKPINIRTEVEFVSNFLKRPLVGNHTKHGRMLVPYTKASYNTLMGIAN